MTRRRRSWPYEISLAVGRGGGAASCVMLARSTRQRLDVQASGASGVVGANGGIMDEKVLQLVFKAMNYNPFLLAKYALVCKRFADVMKRVIWKEFCLSRAPKMVEDLLSGTAGGRGGTVAGGWLPLGKLLFHCPGSHQSKHFYSKNIPDHFVFKSRFSKTAGKSFLPVKCRSDTLYISDCCEHLDNGDDDDLGVYRGMFRAFGTSRTRRFLIENRVNYAETELCPFCSEKVLSPILFIRIFALFATGLINQRAGVWPFAASISHRHEQS